MKKLLMILAASVSLPAMAAAGDAVDSTVPEEIAEHIEAWIMENPDKIMASLTRYQERIAEEKRLEQEAKALELRDRLVKNLPATVMGNPKAKFTIVKFSDYGCPHCQNAHKALDQVLQGDKDIRVIYLEYPVLGRNSFDAARFALAVAELQGREAWAQLNEELFTAGRDAVNMSWLASFAEEKGWDATKIQELMESKAVLSKLQEIMTWGRDLGVTGTPFMIVGNSTVAGGLNEDDLEKLIASERAQGKARK